MRLSKLPERKAYWRAKERYDAICAELEKREHHHSGTTDVFPVAEDKCVSCIHNIGATVMDCEYACVGVEEIADEGRVTIRCSDYERREERQ